MKLLVKLTLAFSLLCIAFADIKCQQPQKAYYLSYDALSKRDTIENLFKELDSKMNKFNYTYNDGKGNTYVILNLLPQLYYNEHYQKQQYLDSHHVNVTLGDITLTVRFQFSLTLNNGTKLAGTARARVLLDHGAYFIKMLMIKDGYLQWEPTEGSDLTSTMLFQIFQSEPALDYDQKSKFELILNDHTGQRKLKQQIMQSINEHYKTNLKQHLNKEDVIGTTSISYIYRNIKVNFLNVIKNYTLSHNQVKGLEAFFFFEVENKTTNCTPEKFIIDSSKYGGVQEIYALTLFKDALYQGLEQGLANIKLDKRYEVRAFQFYMGDLANSVKYASNFPADDTFQTQCKWDGARQNVYVRQYEDENIYVQFSVKCIISYKARQILSINMPINYVVRLYPEDDTLSFFILAANHFFPQIKSLDPNFVLTNELLARYSIGRVVQGLSKQLTFGSDFKISSRKFPSVRIQNGYVILFDPSEK